MNLDDAVSATCTVTKGDLPLSIFWSFTEDNSDHTFNLTTNDGVVITRSSQKNSMLSIDAVKAHHKGNYTCIASNKAGTSQHSTFLRING